MCEQGEATAIYAYAKFHMHVFYRKNRLTKSAYHCAITYYVWVCVGVWRERRRGREIERGKGEREKRDGETL